MGWADRELQRERADEQARRFQEEQEVRKTRVKDERGPLLFEELKIYVTNQIETYNSAKKAVVYAVDADVPALVRLDSRERNFRVKCAKGLRGPLKVFYSPVTHILEWESGAGKGHFLLRTREDGTVYFETPHHVYMSIEEIVDDMLSKFCDSQF